MISLPVNMGFNDYDDDDSSEEECLDVMITLSFPRRRKVFLPRKEYFNELREADFIDRFRLSKDAVLMVLNKIRKEITSPTDRNSAVSPEQKLLLTLRYYATGSMLRTCADFIGIHISTASRIVRLVSHHIAMLRPEFISMPTNATEMRRISQEFFDVAKFPRCIGAIDCTHVRIQSPGGDRAEIFRNRKSWFSINVQTICDAKLNIQNIVARWPGSSHDSTIFRNSAIYDRFERKEFGDYVLVGDSGYALSNYLLTPIGTPKNAVEDLYNESQIGTRNAVERSYGVWKRRFPVLSVGMRLKRDTVFSVIVATAVLHNIARYFGGNKPRVPKGVEELVKLSIFPCSPITDDGTALSRNTVQEGRVQTRNRCLHYFHTLHQQEPELLEQLQQQRLERERQEVEAEAEEEMREAGYD